MKLGTFTAWFDSSRAPVAGADDRVDWVRCLPFFGIHLLCLAAFWTGVSTTALVVAGFLYFVRVFAVTGFYHRYFSHRTFRTSRAFQFVMAVAGNLAVQRGPIWWAAHHRHHHLHSEQEPDLHSPVQHGFWKSHLLWFLTDAGFRTQTRYVRDWLKYPELRALDRFDWVAPVALIAALAGLGAALGRYAPALNTTASQLVVWGFAISTVAVYHATYTINSLAHRWGSRRFDTKDDSRNNFLLALLTMGEGWHNNHHHYPASARQGFYWWEIDLTYYGLVALSWLGLIRDLRPVPAHVLVRNRTDTAVNRGVETHGGWPRTGRPARRRGQSLVARAVGPEHRVGLDADRTRSSGLMPTAANLSSEHYAEYPESTSEAH